MQPKDAADLSRELKGLAGRLFVRSGTLLPQAVTILDATVMEVATGRSLGGDAIARFTLAMQDGSLAQDAFLELVAKPPPVQNAERRLRDSVSGPLAVPLPAEGDDQGRDGLWELFIAALVRRAGFEPVLGSQRKPDVALTVDGVRLGAEAKRLRSRGQLSNRVSKAVEQISRNVDAGVIDAGFVALDLSFALDQHAQQGYWVVPSRRNLLEVRASLQPLLTDLAHEVRAIVDSCPSSRTVVGTTILLLPTVGYTDTRRLGLVRSFTHAVFQHSNRSPQAVAAYHSLVQIAFSDA